MNSQERKRAMKKIIENYGEKEQLLVAIQELNALSIELVKSLREKHNNLALKEEVADVAAALGKIKIIFEIAKEDVDSVIDQKLQRLINRIEEKAIKEC